MDAKNAFVIGYPIKHSRSPLIHNFWLMKYNVNGEYLKIEVTPDDIKDFLGNLPTSPFCGGNVTIPHKEVVLKSCDTITDLAKKIGAVNTIWLENGRLCGDNTDGLGFLANLDAEAPGWDRNCERAAVIGAGGAARAILAGLAMRGVADVTILNRSAERMMVLAEEVRNWGFARVATKPLDGEPGALAGQRLLVNTTSLGMTGQPELTIDLDGLADDAVVSDIVYAPLETRLLIDAKRRGHRVSSGLGMLMRQAVPGFERWFGIRPQVTSELRDLLTADLVKVHG